MTEEAPYKPGPRFGQKARYRAATVEYVLSGEEMHRFWERENNQADRIVELEKENEALKVKVESLDKLLSAEKRSATERIVREHDRRQEALAERSIGKPEDFYMDATEEMILNPSAVQRDLRGCRRYRLEYGGCNEDCTGELSPFYIPPSLDIEEFLAWVNCEAYLPPELGE